MLARTIACGLEGVNGFRVDVEAYLTNGMYGFEIVGLPGAAVKESRDRVSAAITVSGLKLPFRKTTINLAPADVRKEGSGFELAIAIAILAAETPAAFHGLEDTLLLGELSMHGELLPIRGALPMAISAMEMGIGAVVLPRRNALELSCLGGMRVYPAETLTQAYRHLTGAEPIAPQPQKPYEELIREQTPANDLGDVRGQMAARKALEVAAAGGHNMLMVGIPGSGKTMLARCLPGILPPLTYQEALQTTRIHSAAGEIAEDVGILTQSPFRSPHHNASLPSMIGGGRNARPGEVSLAHNGVLFLDELPEYQRSTLEALRQPLEDGFVNVTRVNSHARYQSRCMLVAGMNPCPCGYHGSQVKACHCSPGEIKRYLARISGPLLDRIDIQVEMDAVGVDEIQADTRGESSLSVRKRVLAARALQQERYREQEIFCNAQLTQKDIDRYCVMTADARDLLLLAVKRFGISMRAYGRIRKVARTLADLAGRDVIDAQDMAQAVQYRNLEGKYWR